LAQKIDDDTRRQLQLQLGSKVINNQTLPVSSVDRGEGPWWDAYRRKFEGLHAYWERHKELERERRKKLRDGRLEQPGQKNDIDVNVGRDLERIRTGSNSNLSLSL
jgi:hypothetical protein